jgi:hypothetical protein
MLAIAALIALFGFSSLSNAQELSDKQITEDIIQECIAMYRQSRPCPCPYSGFRCFINAWRIPGGAKPFCYKEDVSAGYVSQYRTGDKRFIVQRCTARP